MPLLDPRPAHLQHFQMPPAQGASLKRPRDDSFDQWLDSRSASPSASPAPPVQAQGQTLQHAPLRPASPSYSQQSAPAPSHVPNDGERIIKRRRLAPRAMSSVSQQHAESSSAAPGSGSGSGSGSPADTRDNRTPPPRAQMHEYSQINNFLHTLHTLRTHVISPGSEVGTSSVSGPGSPFLPSSQSQSVLQHNHGDREGQSESSCAYEVTNRILGSLALERQKRMGIPGDAQSDAEEDGDEGADGWSGEEVDWEGDMDM
ncbi:hypothetical protein CALCODRAFT_494954 [Calocera cornea HHB12733]|uniref:Uncharacterized protein n=1 Tax=Calocera cornea HHB12733 TaxID=1353952 RepID=A0A165GTH4_9BASI|nr:hypothetical protein CALCODRAFT_494954 [Calocera cornea HHB12733]